MQDKILCTCFGIYKSEIVKAIEILNINSIDELKKINGAGKACGKCELEIIDIIKSKKSQKIIAKCTK